MTKKEVTAIVEKMLKAQKENVERTKYVNDRMLESVDSFMRTYDCDENVIRIIKQIIRSLTK